ncbi:MAG: hypothetical protein HY787_29740 [Deltaproteobacteria bacterium]|nr:hypothetical protein [Deltaproteobacteria bacterium]
MDLTSSTFVFLKELGEFSYELSVLDCVWDILFPDQREKWNLLHINKYKDTFYITHVDGDSGGLEVEPDKGLRAMTDMRASSSFRMPNDDQLSATWEPLITSARKWLTVVKKDWIRAYQQVQTGYPVRHRYGVVPNAFLRASLPDIYRLDKELGKARTRKLVRLIEDGYFLKTENTEIPSMTATSYFKYCKIAYLTGKHRGETVDASLSGRKMYTRYADGRHEGLLDIDPASEQEFADWIDGTHPKRGGGGHPWEIKRGGNTTHVDLIVSRPSLSRKEGFKVELQGESIGSMVETMCMFLAIHEAKLPISIANPEGVRKRLLGQDNIGIIPSYASRHRADRHFKREEDVYDVMYYDDLSRFKRRITPFITWEQLPILKPREV